MKKLLFVVLFALSTSASAYYIGGAYATLVKCEWGQWGYQWGNIGTYDVGGRLHEVFFPNSYCKY